MKKYEFTGETKTIDLLFRTITLRRIRATISFGIVKDGDVGGWIENEKNLDQYGNAWVFGDARVFGNAWVSGDAMVSQITHLLAIGPAGSRNDFTTFYRDKDKEISVKCGCFCGKINAFLEKVASTHGDSKHALVYRAAVELAKAQIDLTDNPEEKEREDDE